MAAKKLFTQIFIYFSKPLRLLYSLIIYEIVNFSFFLHSLLFATSFFLSISEKCSYIRDCSCMYILYTCACMHVHVHACFFLPVARSAGIFRYMYVYMYIHACFNER